MTPLRPSFYGNRSVDTLSQLVNTIQRIVIRSWWVIVCCLLAYAAYERSKFRFHQEYSLLSNKLNSLQEQKELLLDKQELLQREIASQDDPAWIELTLIRALGMVAEEQTMVYFTPKQLREKE